MRNPQRLHTPLGPQPWQGDPLAASTVVLVYVLRSLLNS